MSDFIEAKQGAERVWVRTASVEAAWVAQPDNEVRLRGASGAEYTLGTHENVERALDTIRTTVGAGDGAFFVY